LKAHAEKTATTRTANKRVEMAVVVVAVVLEVTQG
jgi:hypothetical protein